MANKKYNNPHDAYIKKYLQDPIAAKHFLEAHISQEIVQKIDFDTLTLTNKSFVQEDTTEIHSDLVFRFKFKDGQSGYIFTLFEHLSTAVRVTPLRMTEYVLALLKSDHREHPTTKPDECPVVIPLVFYHGKQSPYPYAHNAYDCTSDPELARSVRMFEGGRLVDVTSMSDDTIGQHKTVSLMEKAMKYCRARDFLTKLQEHFQSIIVPLAKHFLTLTLEYSLYISDERKIPEEKLVALFEKQLTREDIMTIAKRIEQRGMQRGRQEGMQAGRQEGMQAGRQEGMQAGMQRGRQAGRQEGMQAGMQEAAKNLIKQGVSLDIIAKATGLSKEALARLS